MIVGGGVTAWSTLTVVAVLAGGGGMRGSVRDEFGLD
jgi:hypothetical protein